MRIEFICRYFLFRGENDSSLLGNRSEIAYLEVTFFFNLFLLNLNSY